MRSLPLFSSLPARLTATGGHFDPDKLAQQLEQLEQQSQHPDFWQQPKQAEQLFAQAKIVRNRYQDWKQLRGDSQELLLLSQLAIEENDQQQEQEIVEDFARLQQEHHRLLNRELLGNETDQLSAFLTIHSGAGGTEACDWVTMLYRMYSRWIEQRQFKANVIELVEAEGGIKSITIQINGEYANGLLQGESGIHRLVRISPFDANSRRHTSFASVYVSPVLNNSIEVEIKADELRVDTYRSSGAGGQHVNTTDSAVRITHLPTGITVQCQNERSQHKNRDTAMKILRSRLYEYYRQQQESEQLSQAAQKKEIGWGSQIRSYVFQPYTMVKDLRTRHETSDVQRVIDGDLDLFIDSYPHWYSKAQLKMES